MAKWIFAAIVAIGLLAAFNLQSCAGMVAQFQAGREAQARERLRTQLISNENIGPFFRQFETAFPEEFDAFLEGGRDLERRRAGQREVFEFAQTYMADFVATNQHYVVQAEPGELTALGASVGAMLSALRGEDTRACADYLRTGATSYRRSMSLSPSTRQIMTDGGNAMLSAIASGKRQQTHYSEPTEAEAAVWLCRFTALGGDPDVLAAFEDEARFRLIDPAEICRAGDLMWQAVLQMPGDFVPRFVSMSMGLS
jgi:hypothetical protein